MYAQACVHANLTAQYCGLPNAAFRCCNILQKLKPKISEVIPPLIHDIKTVHFIPFGMFFEDLFLLNVLRSPSICIGSGLSIL